jgi:glycosyltransferase involved in cell wall biosynthesis
VFKNIHPEPIHFRSPWESETLSQRLTELLEGPKTRRVAYLYDTPDTSTFRYRVYNMVEGLRNSKESDIKASWFASNEIPALRSVLPSLSVLVMTRVKFSQAVSDLITAANHYGIRVLMDCDDLVFDLRYAQLVSENNSQPFYDESHLDSWYAYVGRLNATALQCVGGITTNKFLAEKLENVCDGPVSIVQNFLNKRQEDLSRKLLAAKSEAGFRGDGRVMIGYFSGSPTHDKDFQIALDSIVQIMDKDPNVDIRIVGFMRSHAVLGRFGERVSKISLQDWLNLQVKTAEVDIAIAPLQLNDFTHSKSELKFFEAAAVGCYCVASCSYTFERAIRSHDNGILVNNGNWFDALNNAISLVRDPELYAPKARQTAEEVYNRYGWDKNTDAIISALSV